MSIMNVSEVVYEALLAHFPEWVEDEGDRRTLTWDAGIDQYWIETDCEHGGHVQPMVEIHLIFDSADDRTPIMLFSAMPYTDFLSGGLTPRLADIRSRVDFYEVARGDLDDVAERMQEIVQEAGPGED